MGSLRRSGHQRHIDFGCLYHLNCLRYAHIAHAEEHNTSEDNIVRRPSYSRGARSLARPESINGDETRRAIRLSKTALGKRKAVNEPKLQDK